MFYTQPPFFKIRLVDAGLFFKAAGGRIGRLTKLPEQLGQTLFNTDSAQLLQNVHSNVQITASVDSGGRSLSQHSQLGLNSNIFESFSKKIDILSINKGRLKDSTTQNGTYLWFSPSYELQI